MLALWKLSALWLSEGRLVALSYAHIVNVIPICFVCHFFFHQGKFVIAPVVLVTAEHHQAGLKRNAAIIWTEDVTRISFKVCLRELQNFDGAHKDIYVVSYADRRKHVCVALCLIKRHL